MPDGVSGIAPITIPAGAVAPETQLPTGGAEAFASFMRGEIGGEQQAQAQAEKKLTELMQMFGPEAVSQPEWNENFKRRFGHDWPEIQEIVRPAQPARPGVSPELPSEAITPGIMPAPPVAAQPPVTETRPMPLGGKFADPLLGQMLPFLSQSDDPMLQEISGLRLSQFKAMGGKLSDYLGNIKDQKTVVQGQIIDAAVRGEGFGPWSPEQTQSMAQYMLGGRPTGAANAMEQFKLNLLMDPQNTIASLPPAAQQGALDLYNTLTHDPSIPIDRNRIVYLQDQFDKAQSQYVEATQQLRDAKIAALRRLEMRGISAAEDPIAAERDQAVIDANKNLAKMQGVRDSWLQLLQAEYNRIGQKYITGVQIHRLAQSNKVTDDEMKQWIIQHDPNRIILP